MRKTFKHNVLFAIVLLFALSNLYICSSSMLTVHAAAITSQLKGLEISKDVIGLELTKYTTTSKEESTDSYLGALSQENVRYILESKESKLDILYTFTEGNLRMIDVLESTGSPIIVKPTANVLETAKDFLSHYQSYSRNPFYGELSSMLDNIDANNNSATIIGNKKLEVTNSESGYTTFRWTYTVSGFEASDKCVSISYKNGFLKYFVDNWNIYKIGSTSINTTIKEALDISIAHATTFSWNVSSNKGTFEVKEFNVTQALILQQSFCSSFYADKPRTKDPLVLYPIYHVWVSLDKFYSGNVYGIEVYIWADTKDLCHIQERFSTLDPPADQITSINIENDKPSAGSESKLNSISPLWLIFPISAAVILGVRSVYLSIKRRSTWFYSFPRIRFFKIFTMLLCLLICSPLLSSISAVDATLNYGRATVWGAESTAGYNSTMPPEWQYYRKTQFEVLQQQATAQEISAAFSINGYNASNYQGGNSTKNMILGNISFNEANYPRVAVVDFDHGVGRTDYMGDNGQGYNDTYGTTWHFMFEDNVGENSSQLKNGGDPNNWVNTNMVYDMDIYNQTSLGKTFFVLINACKSADLINPLNNASIGNNTNGKPVGMPYAWTHRYVGPQQGPGANLSINGYLYPDNSAFCYMGFFNGSAALNQTVQSGSAVGYHTWVEKFFAYALMANFSVTQSLELASLDVFNRGFWDTDLYKGYLSVWPISRYNPTSQSWYWVDTTGTNSRLVVYGNGNIMLYQPMLTLDARDNYGSPVFPVFYLNGTSAGTSGSTPRIIAGNYTVDVNATLYNCTFSHFSCDGINYYSRPANIPVTSDRTLTAHYITALQPHPPATLSLIGPSPPQFISNPYNFTAQATDPDGDNLYYIFDWGDDTQQTTIGLFASGTTGTASHTWSSAGQFNVKVRAQDAGGASSEWSTPLTVTIYNPPPPQISYYMLTVPAYDSAGSSVTANVYIDGDLRGTTGQSFNVSSEYHSLQVSIPEGYTFYSYAYYSGTYYSNPHYIGLTQDTTVTVNYAWNDSKASTVAAITDPYAIWHPTERKSFQANDLFWVFYTSEYHMVYKTSADGGTWSTAIQIAECDSGSSFSIYFNGTYVHYVNTFNGWMTYRRGLPNSDGTITWSAPAQTVLSSGFVGSATLSVDSNGYPFIGYYDTVNSCVLKASTNNGTWSTASGFPYTLAGSGAPVLVSMTAGKVYVFYQGGGYAKGKLWNGSSWGNEENIPGGYYDSVVSQADTINVVYGGCVGYWEDQGYPTYAYAISHVTRTTSWVSPQQIQYWETRDFYPNIVPSLTLDSSNNQMYCFWSGIPAANHVCYTRWVNGAWDSTPTDWIRDSVWSSYRMASFDRSGGNKIGVIWMTAFPYAAIRFAYLNLSGVFQDDFESGNLNAWTDDAVASGCTFTSSSNVAYNGSYSGRAAIDGDAVSDYSLVYKNLGSFSTVSTRAYFYLTALPSSGKASMLIGYTSGYDDRVSVFIKNSGGTYYLGIIRYVSGSSSRQVVTTPVSLSANNWFAVEFSLVISGSAGSERVYLNGVEQAALTRSGADNDGGGSSYDLVNLGVNGWDTNVMGQGGVNWAFNMYVDCVAVGNSYVGLLGSELLFSDGFESGSIGAWTDDLAASGCTFTASTNAAYSGSYSGRAAIDGDEVSDYALVYKNLNSFSTVSTRAYFNLNVLPTSGRATMLIAYSVGSDDRVSVFLKNSGGTYYLGIIRYVAGSTSRQVVSSAVSLSANSWFAVEFSLVISGSAGSERVYLNGVEQEALTRTNVDNDGGGSSYGWVDVGANGWDTNVMGQGGVNWAFNMYVDAVAVGNSYVGP